MPVQVRLKRSIPVPRVIFYGLIAALVLLCVLCIALPLLIHLLKPRCAKTDDTSIVEPPIRLSSSLIPEKYFLSIKLFLPSSTVNYDRNMDFTFSGNVTIHFQCVQETSEIALHVDRLRIAESSFHLVERSLQAKQIKLDKMQTFVAVEQTVFRLAKPLKPGAYALHLSYSGILSESLEGFYRSSYVENNEKKWLAVTQFQPTHARRALPCFDEPHLKAEFAITVTAPSNMKALSNAIEESERLIGGGWKTTRYKLSPKMSTYLVAIVVCEFEHTAAKTKRGTLASFRDCQSHVNCQFCPYSSAYGLVRPWSLKESSPRK
uniref:Aminopeptidase N-like N-terminal domain-containing protein n=1 Tax=Plectus sambesii TaxID=2011161 RepID=A0A914X0B4_9BILA